MNLPRESFLSPDNLQKIKTVYESGAAIYVDGIEAKALNDFNGHKFTDFLDFVEATKTKLDQTIVTDIKSFAKVFYDGYLARFSVNETAPFAEIEAFVNSSQVQPEQTQTPNVKELKSLIFSLNREIENYIIAMESHPKEFATTDYLISTVFPRLIAIVAEKAKGEGMPEICEQIKQRFIVLSNKVKEYSENKNAAGAILVDDREYNKDTKGRESRLVQTERRYMFLEQKPPLLILAVLQEKINNDIMLPFTDLNAEIKVLAGYNSMNAAAAAGGIDKLTPHIRREYKKLSAIVKNFNINKTSLIEQSFKMFMEFMPKIGMAASKEQFLLLNRFFHNRKGASHVRKTILFPVLLSDGTQVLKFQQNISLDPPGKKAAAGSSFEQLFKQKLVSEFGGAPKKIVVKDSAGFITRIGVVDPNDIVLTSEGAEDARLNAHADLFIKTEDGKNLFFSLKKKSFGYLSGTNLERGNKDMRHEEIMKSPMGRKWYSDIAQFNAEVGAVFAAALPEVLSRTEQSRQKIIKEFSDHIFTEYGQNIADGFSDLTVASLKEYAGQMIKQGGNPQVDDLVKSLIGKISTLRKHQTIGAKTKVSTLENILIKKEFRLWRMIYEQTLETKCLFGEERDSVKAGLGFENVSHMIVDMPKITQNGDYVVIEPDASNAEQFVVANKNFKMISPVQSKETASNSQAASYKYSEFFKRALPVMMSRKQGGQTSKKHLDVVGLGCETVPVKELDKDGNILNSTEAVSSFNVIIDAGKEQDKNKYIMGLKSLSDVLNSKFQQESDSPMIRLEGSAVDRETLVSRINSGYATSYKINLVIALSLMDSKVNIGAIEVVIRNKGQKLMQESLVKIMGLMNDTDFALLENVVLPKEPIVPQEQPMINNINADIQKVLTVAIEKALPKLKQQLEVIGSGVAKRELSSLKQLGVSEEFSYTVQVALDNAAITRYVLSI